MLLRFASLCFIFEKKKRSVEIAWQKSHFLCIHIHMWVWVSLCVLKWNFQAKKERTYFYMKWCHKLGFVPHFHNFHIRLLLNHQQNECLPTMWQFEYYIFYLYVNSTEMVQLQMSFAQCFLLKWPTIPQMEIFTNWPMIFFVFTE